MKSTPVRVFPRLERRSMLNAPSKLHLRLTGVSIAIIVVTLAVLLGPRLGGPSVLSVASPAASGDSAALAAGKALFSVNCAVCHGAGGKGDGPAAAGLNPPPADFTNPIHRAHTDADLIGWITNGLPGSAMPAFTGKLTDSQMREIVVYLRSLSAGASGTAGDAPDPSLCTVAPRSPAAYRTPDATPAPAPTQASAVGPDFRWPQGTAATQAEIDGITASIREFYACANASDYGRQIALYTDRFIVPQFAALDSTGWQTTLAYAAASKTPVASLDWESIAGIRDVRKLPDGRVGAYIEALNPVNHPHQIDAVVIFAPESGRWLIDEVHEDPNNVLEPTATAGAVQVPSAGIGTPVAREGLVLNLTRTGGGVALSLTNASGAPITDARVSFVGEMLEMSMGALTANAGPNAQGVYAATLPFSMAGTWRVTAQITKADGSTTTFAFLVPVTGS